MLSIKDNETVPKYSNTIILQSFTYIIYRTFELGLNENHITE